LLAISIIADAIMANEPDDNLTQFIVTSLGIDTKSQSNEEEYRILEAEDHFDREISSLVFNICRKGDKDELQRLHEKFDKGTESKKFKKCISNRDDENNTPFHYAAMNCHQDTLEYLLEDLKVNVDELGQNQMSALHLAARYGDEDNSDNNPDTAKTLKIVKFLVGKRAKVALKDKYGYTVLHHAVLRKKVSLVEYLLKRPELHYVVDRQGNTAFHLACLSKNSETQTELIEKFIEAKVRLNFGKGNGRNKEKKTILHLAAANCKGESASNILKRMLNLLDGYNPKDFLDIKDSRGYTAFMEAAGSGNHGMVNLFLKEELVSCHVLDDEESLKKSLHISARNGHNEILEAIFEKLCEDKNAPTGHGTKGTGSKQKSANEKQQIILRRHMLMLVTNYAGLHCTLQLCMIGMIQSGF